MTAVSCKDLGIPPELERGGVREPEPVCPTIGQEVEASGVGQVHKFL